MTIFDCHYPHRRQAFHMHQRLANLPSPFSIAARGVCLGVVIALLVSVPVTANGQTTVGVSDARPLAPGVLKTIPSTPNVRDSFSMPMQLPGIKATEYQPATLPKQVTLYELSRRVVMFRDVWQYEFSFTGLRQMAQKVRFPDGSTGSENVWYMVYRIRNLGSTLTFDQVKTNPDFDSAVYELRKDKPVDAAAQKFQPRFSLEGWVIPADKSEYERVKYRDQIEPTIANRIQAREDIGRALLDTVAISQVEIPVVKDSSEDGVWGVAVWRNVDPRLDYVSVFVSGLTNAFRIDVQPGGNIDLKRKTLQLNFWRPGDTVSESDDQVDYGIPLVDDAQRQVEITKRYQLPGPVLRVYHDSKLAHRDVLVAEIDGQVDLESFKSQLTAVLDGGKLPAEAAKAIQASGLKIPANTKVKTVVAGQRWSVKLGDQDYGLALEPQYWEPDFGGIRFIKSLDHLWIYR